MNIPSIPVRKAKIAKKKKKRVQLTNRTYTILLLLFLFINLLFTLLIINPLTIVKTKVVQKANKHLFIHGLSAIPHLTNTGIWHNFRA